MDIVGKIIQALEPQSGVSKAGREWKKREYVMEIPSNNPEFPPRKVCFNFFGNAADQNVLAVGKDYRISFDIESREFNGRWFTDIRAWRSEEVQPGAAASAPAAPAGAPEPPVPSFSDPLGAPSHSLDQPEGGDDLPF